MFSKPFIWIDNFEDNNCKSNQDCLVRIRIPVSNKPKQIILKFLFTINNPEPTSIINYNYDLKNYKSFSSRKEGTEFYFTQTFNPIKMINDVSINKILYFSLNSIVEKGQSKDTIAAPKHFIWDFSMIRRKPLTFTTYSNRTTGQEIKNIKVEYPYFLKKANLTIDFDFTYLDNILQFYDRSVVVKDTDILTKISISGWEFCSANEKNCILSNNQTENGSFLELNFTLKYFNTSFVNQRDFNINENSSSIVYVNLKDENPFESYYSVLVPASKNKTEFQFLIETPMRSGNFSILLILLIVLIIIVSIILIIIFLKCRKQQINSSFIENSKSGFVDAKI